MDGEKKPENPEKGKAGKGKEKVAGAKGNAAETKPLAKKGPTVLVDKPKSKTKPDKTTPEIIGYVIHLNFN